MDSLTFHHYFVLMQIDHDRDEPPRDRSGMGLYWANLAVLTILWIWMLSSEALDWKSLALGAWSGLFVATWGIEMTGNKAPRWMRTSARR